MTDDQLGVLISTLTRNTTEDSNKSHREEVSDEGMSEQYFALVHKPVKQEHINKIPEARAAVDKEWNKLKAFKNPDGSTGAWNYATVREKRDVMLETIKSRKPAHFATVMVLCHIKNAQLDKSFWSYKGRVVLRGDTVKNEAGQYAVFGEQGTSASHLMGARLVDALAHMPDMAGWDSDVTGAYTQVILPDD